MAIDRFARSPYGFGLQCAPGGRLVFSDFGDLYSDEPTFRWSNALAYADEADSDIVVLREDIPGFERFQFLQDGVPITSGPRPWGRTLSFASTAEGVWMSTGDAYEIEFLDWTGTTTRRILWAGPDQTITNAHLDTHRDELCGAYRIMDVDNWEEMCAGRWEAERGFFPSIFPAVSRMLVADDGRLWVEHFRRPRSAREWIIFDRNDRWVATVRIPARMYLQDAGADWVLVRHTTDDLGVETLAVYSLTFSQG